MEKQILQGREVIIEDVGGGFTDATAPIYLPPLPIGENYTFTFTPTGAEASLTTPPAITVVAETFDSRTFELRRVFSPNLRTGPRRTDDVDVPQE